MLKSFRNNSRGFTLVELIIIMMLIGILVLLALPRFGNFRDRAKVTQIKNDTRMVELLINIDLISNDLNPKDYCVGRNLKTIKESILIDKTGLIHKLEDGYNARRLGNVNSGGQGQKLVKMTNTMLDPQSFYLVYKDSDFRVAYRAVGEISQDYIDQMQR